MKFAAPLAGLSIWSIRLAIRHTNSTCLVCIKDLAEHLRFTLSMPRYGIVLERSLGTRHKIASITRIPQLFDATRPLNTKFWLGTHKLRRTETFRFSHPLKAGFVKSSSAILPVQSAVLMCGHANATKPQAAKQRVPSCLGICHLFSHDSKNGSRIGSLITYDQNLQCQNFTYRGGTITPLKPCPFLSLQFSGSSQSL